MEQVKVPPDRWPIVAVAGREQFWMDYFWQTSSDNKYPELLNSTTDGNRRMDGSRGKTHEPRWAACCRLDFPVSENGGLVLELNQSLGCFLLDLLQPDGERIRVAWDDQAQWHPYVLRWRELDLICRCVSRQHASLSHPGTPLLLLYRFAPICIGDDVELIFPLLRRAWRSLQLFSDDRIEKLISLRDRRRRGFVWRQSEACGWSLEQGPSQGRPGSLHSLRRRENNTFPFEAWARMFADAEGVSQQSLNWR
jgi:hypothetical protein